MIRKCKSSLLQSAELNKNKEINLKSKIYPKRISKSDASKKYLSWFKDYQVKEFIENSGTISIKILE